MNLSQQFALYDVDITNVMIAIEHRDADEVQRYVEILYTKYCQTPLETINFLRWLLAQHALTLFELLGKLNMSSEDEIVMRSVMSDLQNEKE